MKKLLGGMFLLAFAVPAFGNASIADESDYAFDSSEMEYAAVPANEKAITAFVELQKQGKNADLTRQVAALKKGGHNKMGTTRSNVLSGSCGTAGCDYTFFVTTPYLTEGANTRMSVVAAVVHVKSAVDQADVKKVLNQKEIQALVRY